MQELGLYISVVLIWGSTWLAIQHQLSVSPIWSIIYRFGCASILFFLICILLRVNLRFKFKQHLSMFLQGFFLIAITYSLFYISSEYLNSGLVALLNATTIIMNILNARIFLSARIQPSVLLGSLIGLIGLLFIFKAEVNAAHMDPMLAHQVMIGSALCLLGTFSGSIGSIIAIKNQQFKIPVLQNNTFSMFYGTMILIIYASITGIKPHVDFSLSYIFAFCYLVIFGTVIAFSAYISLLRKIGADKSAYILLLTPIVATILSSLFENFTWHLNTYVGFILVLLGNALIIKRKSKVI